MLILKINNIILIKLVQQIVKHVQPLLPALLVREVIQEQFVILVQLECLMMALLPAKVKSLKYK